MLLTYSLFVLYLYPFNAEVLPRIPVSSSPSVNLIDAILMSDCLFSSIVFQKESMALYALYSKNKPQSDALFISHGKSFFKVRFQGVTSVETMRKRFKIGS